MRLGAPPPAPGTGRAARLTPMRRRSKLLGQAEECGPRIHVQEELDAVAGGCSIDLTAEREAYAGR